MADRWWSIKRTGVFRRDKYRCQHCWQQLPAHQLEVDHVTPRSWGGSDADNNLQTLCRPCNRFKGNRFAG